MCVGECVCVGECSHATHVKCIIIWYVCLVSITHLCCDSK